MRRPALRLLLPLLALSACSKKCDGAGDPSLVSTVRTALSERERKLDSYRFDGVTVQGADRAEFTFSYRSPGKMRGDLKSARRTFAFDGRRFLLWDEAARVMTEIDLEGVPRDQAALFLHQSFSPFAPEGWRAPLLGGQLSAEPREKDGKPQLAVTAAAPGNAELAVTFLFTPPAMDFAGKSVKSGGESLVTAQHCDEKLKLCFPTTVEERVPGGERAVTTLSNVQLNLALPPETFELKLPDGARLEKRSLPPQ